MSIRIVDAQETIAVRTDHLMQLARTTIAGHFISDETSAAMQDIAASLAGQDPDATVVLVDAESLWWIWHGSDAFGVYDLDECDAASYEHPAVVAEIVVQRQLMDEAPVTDRALSLITNAETELMILASRGA
jgi:hypothetical protein